MIWNNFWPFWILFAFIEEAKWYLQLLQLISCFHVPKVVCLSNWYACLIEVSASTPNLKIFLRTLCLAYLVSLFRFLMMSLIYYVNDSLSNGLCWETRLDVLTELVTLSSWSGIQDVFDSCYSNSICHLFVAISLLLFPLLVTYPSFFATLLLSILYLTIPFEYKIFLLCLSTWSKIF